MKVLETKHKRKSALITTIILLLLLFVIFNYGMNYLDPPEEYGLAINFGDSNVGSGAPVQKTKKVATPKVEEKKEVVEEKKETPKEIIKEEIITDDTTKDVPVVEKIKEIKKEPVKKETPKEKPKPKPSKATTDALNSLLNGNSSDGQPKGEGDDKKQGVKGNEKGDADANKYYGNTGGGSGGNYNLAGRKALSKPIEQPDCQEEGTVVVRITVDKNGKVISAIPGVKGSTNTAACLLKPAKEAALKTKWNADNKAPSNQTGTIIYKFSLTKQSILRIFVLTQVLKKSQLYYLSILKKKAIIVSGYFNPIHKGHIEYFNRAKELADELFVIVNNDFQRSLKGSEEFQKEDERLLIISNLKPVDKAILSIDKDRTVSATIMLLVQKYKEDYVFGFANGGDQNNNKIPEAKICKELGVDLIDGLGDKIQSSSWLLRNKKDTSV